MNFLRRLFSQGFKNPASSAAASPALMVEMLTHLLKQAALPARAATLQRQVELFKKDSFQEQEKKLSALYLQIGHYLTVESEGRLSLETINARVRTGYPALLQVPSFALLFETIPRQEMLLGCRLLQVIVRRAIHILGTAGQTFPQAEEWLNRLPDGATLPVPFLPDDQLPAAESEWPEFLKRLSREICGRLQHPLGEEATSRLVQSAYQELAEGYPELDSFVSVLGLIPDRLLDNEKLKLLSRNQIAKLLLEKLENLEKSNAALTQAQKQTTRTAQQLREANLELAASNEELQKALRLQEEFTSIVSHELRTPLTAIVGAAGILLQHASALTAQKTTQFLEMIVAESWRLTRLVSEILDLSRIQKKGIALNYMPLIVPDLVAQIVEEMRIAHPSKRLETRFCSTVKHMVGDRDRLRQVLVNLIGNAVKYTPDGAPILVETKSGGEEILLVVADSGVGIPVDQQERVFEAFYRTKDASNYKTPGTGLGLTITKAIVEAMGGRIWAGNQVPHGCVITVALPRQAAQAKAA